MATDSKNLRTGRTVWQSRRAPVIPYTPLTRDVRTDVLVIGAGITGALVAEALSGAGLQVVLADKLRPMAGATSASTALIQYEIAVPLTDLSRKIGAADAARAWRRSRLAVTSLAAQIGERDIPGVVSRDSLYLAGNKMNAADLQQEAEARRAIGLETLYLGRAALKERFGISRAAALLGYGNLAADPRKLTAAFLNAAHDQGARIHALVDIVDVDARKAMVIATTREGHRIRCRHLIFATGYEFPDTVPAKGHRIASTWAIATVPQKSRLWPEQCLIWEASDPYLYLRTDSDGRVICGGEDEEFSDACARDDLLARKTDTLQRKLAKLFPDLDTRVDFAWAACFGERPTGLPIIGAIPRMKNCWAALGYGGNGITYSRIAADILRTALTGGRDPDADLYSFQRRR